MTAALATRLPAQVRHDAHGTYTVFTGLRCSGPGCGVALTSRNRAARNLLCIEHGRAKDRDRKRKGSATFPTIAKPSDPSPLNEYHVSNPQRQALHGALSEWMSRPTTPECITRLQSALTDYELRHRIQAALPYYTAPLADRAAPTTAPSGTPSLPVEEVTFSNPDHRTTRLEFLSACAAHGV